MYFHKVFYRKHASPTNLSFEALSLTSPFNKNFGEAAKAALKDNLLSLVLLIISEKQIQFEDEIIPGHEIQDPKKIPNMKINK